MLDRLPGCLNQPIVAAAREERSGPRPSGGCAVLMHDVGRWLVPVSDDPIPLDQHQRFLAHMAALHASFWDCGPEVDVVPMMHRYLELSPWLAEAEAAAGSDHLVPQLVGKGWPMLADGRPGRRRGRRAAGARSGPAGRGARRRRRRRSCTATGSWTTSAPTMPGGLSCSTGSSRDAAPRSAIWPGTWPSTAVGCRSPRRIRSRTYRAALEACGIDTEPWWDRQLALSLLGALGPVRLGEGAGRL